MLRIRPYFAVGPRVRFYVTRFSPRAGCITRLFILIPLLLLLTRSLVGQVNTTTELRNGIATFRVGNPTTASLHVTVALYRDASPVGGPVTLGDSVPALITPTAFTLPPGSVQTVRIRVRAPVRAGELLRLVTLFVPQETDAVSGVQLVVHTRLITKIRAVP